MDLRDEEQVQSAIDKAVSQFGGIDVLINNASAISLTPTEQTDMKRYDLMHSINARGTFLASKLAIPHLKKSTNPHILNLSPPLEMHPMWFSPHVAYTMAKYGMSMCVLGMAGELKKQGIAVNALWPRTLIWTAAVNMLKGMENRDKSRKPSIIADAAYVVLSKDAKSNTGNFYIDEPLLREAGITDFDFYANKPGEQLILDFFLPQEYYKDIVEPSTKSTSDAGSVGGAQQVLQQIEKQITDTIKNEINAVLAFDVSGKKWFVDSHSSRPFKVLESEPEKVDVTLVTDEDTFVKMAKGQVVPTNAFMTGKLKIKGNLAVAMKVEKLFKKIKAV